MTYWRRVGIPVLAPAALGGMLLLFANAFAAYATAFALSTAASNLVPVQIRFFLQGNTITGKANLGYALAAWMIVIMLVTMAVYLLLRRRAERWRRGEHRTAPGRGAAVGSVIVPAGLPAAYFILPLLAMARFAFQRVPMALLGWSTLFDRWTLDSLLGALDDPQFRPALLLSVRLALGAIILTLGLMLPTAMWVHLRAAQGPRARRDADRAALRRAPDRPRRRRGSARTRGRHRGSSTASSR